MSTATRPTVAGVMLRTGRSSDRCGIRDNGGSRMGGNECSSMARLRVRVMCAIVLLALSFVSGLTLSGQGKREWRDYAGGPDSSRFVASTPINRSNVSSSKSPGRTRPGSLTSIPLSSAASFTAAARNDSFVALDAATGKQLWIHDRRPGLQHPRHQLLGEQGRQGPPAAFQPEQHPAGDRRA